MKKGERYDVRPSLLRNEIDSDAPQYLENSPMDSVDFFDYMFKTIRNKLPNAPIDLAEFDYDYNITCNNCKISFNENENDLFKFIIKPSVPIPDDKKEPVILNIDELIKQSFNHIAHKYKCPNCGNEEVVIKKTIKKAPKYFFVNNRLDYGTKDPDFRKKLCAKLEFDIDNVDISKYVLSGNGHYKLIAFMDHFGKSAKWGHDKSYVRKEGNSFYEFDDDVVTIIENIHKRVTFGQQYLYLFVQK